MNNNDDYNAIIENVDVSQVPDLIQEKLSKAIDLNKELKRAEEKVYEAQEAVINGIGSKAIISKKEAIENLQDAALGLANAQDSAMKAQKLSFDYQQKLADITKFLFRLGISNIALNRAVVNELEARMRNASKEELDDVARTEINNLLKRLKMQQDFDYKQTELTRIVKEQSIQLEEQRKQIEKLSKEIELIKAKMKSK